MSRKPADFDSKQLRSDMFRPNRYELDERFVIRDGKKHPFALVVPGGGYYMVCSFIEGAPIARILNEKGISVFILYYRVKDKARYPAPQDDLARAVWHILSNADDYCVERENYSVWGASAGGHLTASFGTETMGYVKYGLPKPGALILTYPVISMQKELTHMGSHDMLLGKHATYVQELAASVELHVTDNYPRTYIWCGDADGTVPPDNTRNMVKALEAHNIEHMCEIFPGVDHGVGPGTGTAAEGWINRAVKFWLE